MRILLVIDSLALGGAERHVVDLARALRQEGHRIEVACATAGPLADELAAASIPVSALLPKAVKRRVDLMFAWRLRALLHKTPFDVVHAHLHASSVAAYLASRGRGSPFVVTVHSEGTWQGRCARLISGCVYRRSSAIIAVSRGIELQLLHSHRVARERVHVMSNSMFEATPGPPRDSAVCPPDRPLIGVVARLEREKGVDVFLQALPSLLADHPGVRVLVIGEGTWRKRLLEQARSLGLDRTVSFLGARPDARRLISTLDVLVVPSRTEGSPLVALEAMAAGVAVVATRVGGIPDQVAHGATGLLVPASDPEALTEALDLLLRDERFRHTLATQGQASVARRFPYEVVLRGVEQVYSAVSEGQCRDGLRDVALLRS